MKVLKYPKNYAHAHDGCDGAEVLVTRCGGHPVTLDSDHNDDTVIMTQ